MPCTVLLQRVIQSLFTFWIFSRTKSFKGPNRCARKERAKQAGGDSRRFRHGRSPTPSLTLPLPHWGRLRAITLLSGFVLTFRDEWRYLPSWWFYFWTTWAAVKWLGIILTYISQRPKLHYCGTFLICAFYKKGAHRRTLYDVWTDVCLVLCCGFLVRHFAPDPLLCAPQGAQLDSARVKNWQTRT